MKKTFILTLLVSILIGCQHDEYSSIEDNNQNKIISLEEVCSTVSLENELLLRSLAKKYHLTFQCRNLNDDTLEITKQFVEDLLKSYSVVAIRSLNNHESMNVFNEDNITGTCMTYIDSYFDLGMECLVYISLDYGYKTDAYNKKSIWYCGIGKLGVVNIKKTKGYDPYFVNEYSNMSKLIDNSITCIVKGTLMCDFNVEGYRGSIDLKDIYSRVFISPLTALQKKDEDEFWGSWKN